MSPHAGSQRPATAKLLGIESARGVAAILVVFYHAARHLALATGSMPWGGIAQFGHAGVDFFFVLSGFIILFIHRKDIGAPASLAHYAERRFTRIYPFFWVALIVWLALALVSRSGGGLSAGAVLLWASLLPNTAEVGVAWTLQHEILFYLIFSVAILHRRAGIALFGLWLALIAGAWASGYSPTYPALMQRLTSTANFGFFFGMAAAATVQSKTSVKASTLLATGVLLFLGYGVCENLGLVDGYASPARIVYGLSSMLVVMGLTRAESVGTLRTPPLLDRLGAASYSIYLMHLPCIGIAYKLLDITGLLGHLPVELTYLILVASGVTGGVIASRLIEYPLMKLVRQLITGKRTRREQST